MSVDLIIPTLNEIDGIKNIMPKIKNDWVDRILIVDGGSTDNTVDILKKYPHLIWESQKDKGSKISLSFLLLYRQTKRLLLVFN